jgi:hypothetical protein
VNFACRSVAAFVSKLARVFVNDYRYRYLKIKVYRISLAPSSLTVSRTSCLEALVRTPSRTPHPRDTLHP